MPTIYINSILPAVGVGLDADPDYPRIDEYNGRTSEDVRRRGLALY